MFKFLKVAQIILSLLPFIKGAIETIEAQFPDAGIGGQKLELVKTIIEAAYESAGPDGEYGMDDIWPGISKVITYLVPKLTK